MTQILTITGSDNSGWSGLQLDLRIITEIGGHCLTAATCIVMQNGSGIKEIVNFPSEVIGKQIDDIVGCFHPEAVKVGLVRTPEAVDAIAKEIVGCRRIVIAPGVLSSKGTMLIDDDTIEAIKRRLIPQASLLVLRCSEAEKMLDMRIATHEDMTRAARMFADMGAENVMLRGGRIDEERVVALLYHAGSDNTGASFFSSYNIDGWQQHGVGGALSTAITTRLGMGDDVPTAIKNAHEYVHSHIVYSVKGNERKLRPADIYNEFMNLLSNNYRKAHDVAFYAGMLNISTRYLSQITNRTVSKAPKQIIAEYLLQQSRQLLENSRLSVKEISDNLGFSTLTMFCKFFKQQQGVTPSEYRLSGKRE